MPSLREKVTTYFRQLSFIAEPREGPKSARKTEDDENFIIKYLEGRFERIFISGPEIFNGRNPIDLPDLKFRTYCTGSETITAACTGPDDGLTGIKRSKLHLSASYGADIDFIDTTQESDCFEVRKSITNHPNKSLRYNAIRKQTGLITTPTNDQNANKVSGLRSRKNSKNNIANLSKAPSSSVTNNTNENKSTTIVVSMVSTKSNFTSSSNATNDQNNKNVLNSKTDPNSINMNANTTTISNIPKYGDNTMKLLENTTEQLIRAAVSKQALTELNNSGNSFPADSIAGVSNWKMECESAYGISVSLYENNMVTKEPMGNPIADCYGMVARNDAAAMALADGVNWGDGARLAARSAVHGCLDYLNKAVFGLGEESRATSTREVFVSLLRSIWEGHSCILEVGGALSTLTVAVILPLSDDNEENSGKYVVCTCNVGDSLAYVYSKKHGVREITQGSHDITSMRDMRDALGALGPADGNQPELSNLTLSMTIIDKGDIVFLTSDGISDNFDPVVGKFAEAWTPADKPFSTPSIHGASHEGVLAPKRQNKSASAIYARLHKNDGKTSKLPSQSSRSKKLNTPENEIVSTSSAPSRPKYMRSHTVIETRNVSSSRFSTSQNAQAISSKIPKSSVGLPMVTGPQRHTLTLYRLEDLLSYGINGVFSPCVSARRLCHLLIDFIRMITSARRKTLEQRELFYKFSTGPDGIRREVELNRMQHRAARKRVIDSSAFSALPGKLDHATVVAYTVGGVTSTENPHVSLGSVKTGNASLQTKEFQETNF